MWRSSLRYSAVGLEMGIAVALGYGSGWWLDRRFGTEPYLMILMLLLGIAAGFKGVISVARIAMRDARDEEQSAARENDEPDGNQR